MAIGYSKSNPAEQGTRQLICRKIIEILACYPKINGVRVVFKKSSNCVCERMAETLLENCNKYIKILLENKSEKISKEAPEIVFLLLDRSVDPITPLLHSFTYESMYNDILKVSFEGEPT